MGESSTEFEGYERTAPDYPLYPTHHSEALFVRIETDTEYVGWGEALAPVAPQVPAQIIDLLLRDVLLGRDPRDAEVLWQEMYDTMRVRGNTTGLMVDAIAACDIALWDIKGKAAGDPIWRLLGGAHRDEVPVYVSGLPGDDLEEKLAYAEQYVEEGFTTFKCFEHREQNFDLLEALRHRFGDEIGLLYDGYWDYTLDEAIKAGERLYDLDVGFFECPFKPEFIDDHRELRERTGVPVAFGEAERTRYQFLEFCNRDAVDIIQADMGRMGISEYRAIADVAQSFDRQIAPHRSTALGVCTAASLQLSVAVPNFYMLEARPSLADDPSAGKLELVNSVLREPLVCEDGAFSVPSGPGLGVEPDVDRLEAARI